MSTETIFNNRMNDTPTYGGTGLPGSILTLGFVILSHLPPLGDVAAGVAILTGVTTIGLNVQKFLKQRKQKID